MPLDDRLYMIAALRDVMRHGYRTLLHTIFEIVKQSPHTFQLYKVASHMGVVGNEMADKTGVWSSHRLRIGTHRSSWRPSHACESKGSWLV
jgi:hypothetical protein